jgi:hypothetical protein
VRLFAPLIAICAATALASCGGSGGPQLPACSSGHVSPSARGTPPPLKSFFGIVEAAAGAPAVLARLDPLSLKPVSRQVHVAEYHDAWSLSPDGAKVALGVSAGESILGASPPLKRIGIYIVDLRTMRVVKEVQTGVAAEALGWLTSRLLVASLQRGGTVLVDPMTGRIIRRWAGFSFPDSSALTPFGLVLLVPELRESGPNMPLTRAAGPPRLAVIDYHGRLRSVPLKRIPLQVHRSHGISYEERAGLAVDTTHGRAYVVAPHGDIAVVDLRTMRVSYHLAVGRPASPEAGIAGQRGAVWLGDDRIAIYGRDIASVSQAGLTAKPAGATLVDTQNWHACMLDSPASQANLAGRRLFAYGPGSAFSTSGPGAGLRVYRSDGTEEVHLFGNERIYDVNVANSRAYVRTSTSIRVVEVMSGRREATIRTPSQLVDVIGPPQ